MTATYPDEPGGGGEPGPLVRAVLALEQTRAIDPLARAIAPLAEAVVGSGRRRDLLQGRWLGHSAHPVLVTVPLGMWTGVSMLDLFGNDDATRDTARTLTGWGILFALPSALTGLAEWIGTNQRDRRTATIHALSNATALACYVASWRARGRGDQRRGAVLAAVGYGTANVGGFLGGHLTEGRKVGSHHPAIARD